MDLVDIGANLTHDSFDDDRDAVVARAVAAGVRQMVVTGSDVAHSRKAIDLTSEYPGVLFATAGVHPHHARHFDANSMTQLTDLMAHEGVVAAGECGLDYFRNFSPPEAQRKAFTAQLELAAERGLPVFLHQRDAHRDFLAILREYRVALSHAVAHCFTGTQGELEDYLELELYIGVTGWICDERRGLHLRGLVPAIPPERLLIETDAPYLLPRDLDPRPKTRRNEPMYLPHIARTVAACVGATPEELAARTSANARRFFGFGEPVTVG